MSDHSEWAFRIKDILHSLKRIDETLSDLDFASYAENENAQDIVARHFQIIGEAARKIPDDVKNANPFIPWKKMIGLRNFVIHEYHRIDQRIIWETAVSKLPQIKTALLEMDLPK